LHSVRACMGVFTLQHSATHTASHHNTRHLALCTCMYGCIHTATHCNTHCISLQHTAHCTLYMHVWVYSHCNTLQHTLHLAATHCTWRCMHACTGVVYSLWEEYTKTRHVSTLYNGRQLSGMIQRIADRVAHHVEMNSEFFSTNHTSAHGIYD